jgi:hypothetical protein
MTNLKKIAQAVKATPRINQGKGATLVPVIVETKQDHKEPACFADEIESHAAC